MLRAALTCAIEDQVITRNSAAVIRLSARRKPGSRRRPWTADEAHRFLESARRDDDTLYPAYVLVLMLGLRKGELLGLTWERVDFDRAELYVGEQVQRVGHQLIRSRTKTESSEAPLPLPELCLAALKLRRQQQDADHEQAGKAWLDTGLVFTTQHGIPIEPRNFNSSFDRRITRAQVAKITVHSARTESNRRPSPYREDSSRPIPRRPEHCAGITSTSTATRMPLPQCLRTLPSGARSEFTARPRPSGHAAPWDGLW